MSHNQLLFQRYLAVQKSYLTSAMSFCPTGNFTLLHSFTKAFHVHRLLSRMTFCRLRSSSWRSPVGWVEMWEKEEVRGLRRSVGSDSLKTKGQG